MNAGQAREARAAHQMSQHSFGLIVGRVRDGRVRHAALRDHFIEKLVAQPASGVLEIPAFAARDGAHVFSSHFARHAVCRCQLFNKILVRRCVGASKLVIEVQDHQSNPERIAQLEQKPQQRNGIGAARNRNAQRIASAQHPLPRHAIENPRLK
jgi:hypothetical protein